jgi:hypothetical protein
MEIVLDLVGGGLEFEDEIGNLHAATRLDHIEQGALGADFLEFPGFRTALDQEKDATADQREHKEPKEQDKTKRCTRTLEIAFLNAEQEPGADCNADDETCAKQDETDYPTGCRHRSPFCQTRAISLPAKQQF